MKRPLLAGYVLVSLFVVLSILRRNYEFVGYALVLVPFVALIHATDKYFDYKPLAIWGLVVWMLSHLLGGLATIGETRLYDLILVPLVGEPYLILKYDQIVHFFCYLVMALLLFSVVKKIAQPDASTITTGVLVALGASGVGAVNEMIEFAMVVLLNNQGVGGYTNTAIDIVANFLGGVSGAWLSFKLK